MCLWGSISQFGHAARVVQCVLTVSPIVNMSVSKGEPYCSLCLSDKSVALLVCPMHDPHKKHLNKTVFLSKTFQVINGLEGLLVLRLSQWCSGLKKPLGYCSDGWNFWPLIWPHPINQLHHYLVWVLSLSYQVHLERAATASVHSKVCL